MNPELWQRMKPLFEAAVERPPEERAKFIAEVCPNDTEMKAELEVLLRNESYSSPLDVPMVDVKALLAAPDCGLAEGELIENRFKILRHLGSGGMGEVYEAIDLQLGRIALKTIRPDIAERPEQLLRFKKEVQLARKVSSPHVCRIHELHLISGAQERSQSAFLTMEFLEGITLAERIREKGPLPWREAKAVALEICLGLQSIHESGILHRDIKGQNIMLATRNGLPCTVLMDFGIARRISHQTGSTSTAITIDGTVAGTPDYMAPEQFEGKELGAATDVFALGVVLYEALTGRRPFSGEVAAAKAVHARTVPPSISTIQRGVPRDLDRVVSKCLEYDPNRRYQSAKQVSEDLRNGGRSLPKLRNLVRRISGKQPPTFATLLLFFAICGLTLLGVFITRRMQEHTIVPIAERDRVLVTDFQNLTGNPVFDGTIRDLVAQSLGQSSYLNVVSRSSAIDAVKRIGMGDVKEIDTNLGRQICIRENYNAFVTGQISRAGAGYVIAMLVMLPDKEIPIVTETENIHSPGEIYSAVDRLAIRTRRELGESSNSLENASRPLARVTTPSLEALRRYTDAMDHYGAREYARCISLSKDAIDLDANFAMAHLLLARAFEQTGDEVDSRAEFQKARENVGRVGEREKHLILAANFASLEMNEKAADEYQLLLDIYPDDIEALRGFAVSSYWAGRPDQAIAAQQKALTLSPHDVESYDNLMTLLIRTNRFSDALSVFQMAQSRNIHGTNLRFLAALGDWGNEDLDTAQKLLASLDDGTSTYWKVVSKLYTGRLLSYRGHITEAITAFRSGYALVDRPGWESWIPVFQYQIAKGELARGKTETARNECRKYCKSVEDSPTAGNLQRAAVLSISIGDVEFAKRFQKALGMQAKNHSDAFSEMELYTVTGDVYLVEGKFQLAIENQRKALAFISEFEADLGLAEACEHSKDWNCAIEAYTNYLKQKGEILRDDVGSDWSMAHYSLARVYFEAGDRASAIRLNEEFRRLFASGDSSLPILSESKQLANRLGNEAARK